MKSKRKKILLIGPYPPPEGGISIHIKRLLKRSIDYPEIELAVLDIGKKIFRENLGNKKKFFYAVRFFLSSDIVHIHISHPLKSLIGRIAKLFGKKLFFTIHNRWSLEMSSTKALLIMSDQVIFVSSNDEFPESLVIPAYIPPDEGGEISPELKDELTGKRVVVSINTTPKSLSEKPDVYGFDILLNAITKTQATEKLLFVLVDVNGTYESRYKSQVALLNSNSNDKFKILYLSKAVEFPVLMMYTDVYVRANKTDGDSIAVREALAAGVQVVVNYASNYAEGCIIFSVNDKTRLAEKISFALTLKRNVVKQTDYSAEIFKLYTRKIGKTEK